MSADDDTFDIDIYGEDDHNQNEQPQQQVEQDCNQQDGDEIDFDDNVYDGTNGEGADHPQDPSSAQAVVGGEDTAATAADASMKTGPPPSAPVQKDDGQKVDTVSSVTAAQPQQQPQQGTKRKASDSIDYGSAKQAPDSITSTIPVDERPLSPNATSALKLSDLHWWTTEEDLRAFCAKAGVESELRDLIFGEHKINGKSRGEAYLEFESAQAASAAKREVETGGSGESVGGVRGVKFGVWFAPIGNPFPTAGAGGAGGGKKDWGQQQGHAGRGGGAYNNFGNQRGGFGGGRGGYNQNRGGGGFNNGYQNNRPNQQQQQQQGGWGMNAGGYGGGGGFGANPMMGNMGMGMGGYGGGMSRGGGMMGMNMGGMMGRGGYGGGGGMGGMGMNGMNMGNMGMGMGGMGGRGGGMMGRGGWGGGGGGFPQGGMQQGWGSPGGSPGAGGGFQQSGGANKVRLYVVRVNVRVPILTFVQQKARLE